MPEEDAARRRAAQLSGRKALARKAELEAAAEQAGAQYAAASEAVDAVKAQIQSEATRARTAALETTKYTQMLEEASAIAAGCAKADDDERLLEVHAYLVAFASEPRRDAAIASLEPCRKHAARQRKQLYRQILPGMRAEFARGVEDRFDEANPYSRSKLVATVKGETLSLRMSGNFEGRARHSQEQADALCAESSRFALITLRNSHGTFSCRPDTSPQQSIDELLSEAGLADSWLPPESGDRATPRQLPPPPQNTAVDADLQQQQTDAHASLQKSDNALAAAEAEANKARATMRRLDAAQDERKQVWRDSLTESSKSLTSVGVGFGIVGGVSTGIGAYLAYARSSTQESIDSMRVIGQASLESTDKLKTQTGGMIAGLAIGIPLLAIGVILIIAGKQRHDAAQPLVTMTPNGLALRF